MNCLLCQKSEDKKIETTRKSGRGRKIVGGGGWGEGEETDGPFARYFDKWSIATLSVNFKQPSTKFYSVTHKQNAGQNLKTTSDELQTVPEGQFL